MLMGDSIFKRSAWVSMKMGGARDGRNQVKSFTTGDMVTKIFLRITNEHMSPTPEIDGQPPNNSA